MKKGKWLIIIGIVVVLAIVLTIVFINLFTPKYTTELANQINSMTQTGYLNKENENNKNIQAFLEKLKTNEHLQDAKNKVQIEDYLKTLQAFDEMADFYSRELLFTKHTKVYADNADTIIKSLKKANEIAGELGSYFETNLERDEQFQAQAWNTKAKQMKSLFDNTYTAFTKLSAVYTSCVTSRIMNNQMSRAVFKATNYLLAQVKADLETETPIKINSDDLLNFVKAYYPKNKMHLIYNSVYNETALELAKEINDAKNLDEYVLNNKANWDNFLAGNMIMATALTYNFDFEEAA